MNLKKWKFFCVIIVFLLSALWHFGYDWWPNFFTSLLFPVNESIWEHNKIIFGSFFILALIEKKFLKNYNNAIFIEAISSLSCAFIVMIVFTPIYLYVLKTNDNMLITLGIYLLAIIISQILSYFMFKKINHNSLNEYGLGLWLLMFLTNIIFTYYPLNWAIFYDFTNNIYGLK